MSKISQLRSIDAEIVRQIIKRGKLLEKREALVKALNGNLELQDYQLELTEWLTSITEHQKTPEARNP